MSIAVVIPLYNGAPWIREALDSVISQELAPHEVIVVDDGSTDDSPYMAARYHGVKVIKNEGKGSSVARNVGIKCIRSTWVAFLDQDDLWHPAHLRLLYQAVEGQLEVNTVVATASCFEGGSPDYDPGITSVESIDPWDRFPFTIGIEGPSVALVRADTIRQVGWWEECATGMGDALLFLKLSAIHPLLRRCARTVGKRIHASQQWLQVRELGVPYLGFRYEVMRRALDFRLNFNPAAPSVSRYGDRLHALRILQELTTCIERSEYGGIPSIASSLDTLLNNESLEVARHAFYCLMGALFKTHESDRLKTERDGVFSQLLLHWPKTAPLTRQALKEIIGEKPYIS